MKKKIDKYKYVFLFCIIASFSVQFIYIISAQLTFSLLQKVILVFIQILSIVGYTHFHLLNQNEEIRRKGLKRIHGILFLIYVLNLFYILFLDPDFGRSMGKASLSFAEYFKNNVNLDPFESIMLFVNGYQSGVVSLETLLRNLLGNFIVFMPLAYFLPILFESQKKWYFFVLTTFVLVLGVEVAQTLLRIGSGDIDDLLLNISGAILLYTILKAFSFQYLSDVRKD